MFFLWLLLTSSSLSMIILTSQTLADSLKLKPLFCIFIPILSKNVLNSNSPTHPVFHCLSNRAKLAEVIKL